MLAKKVSFIIGTMTNGGAERVISVISNEMAGRGFDISIILFRECEQTAYQLDSRIKQIVLTHKSDSRIKRLLSLTFLLGREMKKENADVYISFCILENIYSCLCKLFTHRKLIISERNAPGQEKIGIMKYLRKLLYPIADGIVFQTKEAQQCYSKYMQKKSVVIANPIHEHLPEKKDYSKKYKAAAIGRLCEQKNYPVLLKAFCSFVNNGNDYILLIYGIGNMEDEIKTYVNRLGIASRVVFKGFTNNVHEELLDTDFYVMSSDYEGMPNALMEAMAIGIPSISTDCPSGGPKELIQQGENGLLVPVGSADALCNRMEFLANNQEERENLGHHAKSIREKYRKEEIAEQWIRFINTICCE